MNISPDIDRLRIASPCPVGWEKMTGSDRVRHCDLCSLNVYNIAEMSRADAQALIANTEGRICARLFRRDDGTIITKDCPVGLRAIRRRVARAAGAVLATILSLCGIVMGQKPGSKDKTSCRQQVKITRVAKSAANDTLVAGLILDPIGAVVAGAEITMMNQKTKEKHVVVSTDEGRFEKPGLAAGVYDITIKSPGFTDLKVTDLKLAAKETVSFESVLIPDATVEVVGVIGVDWPNISPSGMIIIRGDVIQKLPIP